MRDDPKLLLVSGPSGAGRSTAIKALEDLGFEAIDNIPLGLVSRLVESDGAGPLLALGLDVRTRDFSVDGLLDLLEDLGRGGRTSVSLVFLDCRMDVLLRRFSETRRRHPLAPLETPEEGIAREIDLLMPVRERADFYLDTSDLTVHDTRGQINAWFGGAESGQMAVALQSFSYKRGMGRGLDMVFDCRFLKNPHWEPQLRARTGLEQAVQTYVKGDPNYTPFVDKLTDMMQM